MKKIAIIIDPWDSFCGRWLFLVSSQYWLFRRIKKFINSRNDIEEVIIAAYENLPIDRNILNWKSNKKFQFMTEESEFRKYLSKTQVSDIFMCGSAWEMCVENRPLGYTNLHKIDKRINILVEKGCVLDMKGKSVIPDLNDLWIKTQEPNIYKYTPK